MIQKHYSKITTERIERFYKHHQEYRLNENKGENLV